MFENPCQTLFGDLQCFQKVRNRHAGFAVNEMNDAVMSPAEAAFDEDLVRIGDEITVSEEKQLDDLEIDASRVLHRRGQQLCLCRILAHLSWHRGISFPIMEHPGHLR